MADRRQDVHPPRHGPTPERKPERAAGVTARFCPAVTRCSRSSGLRAVWSWSGRNTAARTISPAGRVQATAGSAAAGRVVVPEGVRGVVELVGTQVVDGSSVASDTHATSVVVVLLVDPCGLARVVDHRTAVAADVVREVLHAPVRGALDVRLSTEVDAGVDADEPSGTGDGRVNRVPACEVAEAASAVTGAARSTADPKASTETTLLLRCIRSPYVVDSPDARAPGTPMLRSIGRRPRTVALNVDGASVQGTRSSTWERKERKPGRYGGRW